MMRRVSRRLIRRSNLARRDGCWSPVSDRIRHFALFGAARLERLRSRPRVDHGRSRRDHRATRDRRHSLSNQVEPSSGNRRDGDPYRSGTDRKRRRLIEVWTSGRGLEVETAATGMILQTHCWDVATITKVDADAADRLADSGSSYRLTTRSEPPNDGNDGLCSVLRAADETVRSVTVGGTSTTCSSAGYRDRSRRRP